VILLRISALVAEVNEPGGEKSSILALIFLAMTKTASVEIAKKKDATNGAKTSKLPTMVVILARLPTAYANIHSMAGKT
jgi:hypothetical protein